MRADEPCVHEREMTFPLGRFFFHTGLPCAQCQAEEHAAWVESVRARLMAGLEAAAAGQPFHWDAPECADDGRPFVLARLNDRIYLALAVDEHGRCTAPAAGWYDFDRLRDEAAAEGDERVLAFLRAGVLTMSEAKAAYSRPAEAPFDTEPLFPEAMGQVLHAFLNPEPEAGPPWVHAIESPPEEYDEDGNLIWQPMEPTFTVTAADAADMPDPGPTKFTGFAGLLDDAVALTPLVKPVRDRPPGAFTRQSLSADDIERTMKGMWDSTPCSLPPMPEPPARSTATGLFDALGGVVPGARTGPTEAVMNAIVAGEVRAGRPVAGSRWAPVGCTCPWPWPMSDGRHILTGCPHYEPPPKPVVGRSAFTECRRIDGTWVHAKPHDGCPNWTRGR